MNNTLLKQKHTSVKTFVKVEKDIIKFIKVKFLVSLFTGIGFGLACVFFDVSFPIFWGLFAFANKFCSNGGIHHFCSPSRHYFASLNWSLQVPFYSL